jgi:NitT/TauT family transport system permease protein
MTQSANSAELDPAFAESARLVRQRRNHVRLVHLSRITLVVVVLAVWQFGGGVLFDTFYLGSPRGIAEVLAHDLLDWHFYRDLYVTALEMGLGYFFGALFGVILGTLFARWPFAAEVFDPFFVALNSIPRIALAPLLIIWFGIDLLSKIVLSVTLVFFITFFSTLSGIRSVDRELINVARVMGANDRQIFFKVLLPGATTWIMSGLRMSLPFALIGVIVGEFLASSSGLGYRLNMYSTSYNTNGTFAMLLVMMAFMMVLNMIISFVEARATRWRSGDLGTTISPY